MNQPKIIFYYQTFNSLKPVLYPNTLLTHIHLSSIHFGKDENNEPYIHLNDESPYSKKFDSMWEELEMAEQLGIKIVLMVGGAGTAYQDLFSDFDIFYNQLYHLFKNKPILSGIDLDIEEEVSLDNIKMFISKLKKDFPDDNFTISSAPIQSSLQQDTPGLGGFIYKDLLESDEGKHISYLNGQFYSDYSKEAYDEVVKNGYPSQKVVMGMLSGMDFEDELQKIVGEYMDDFGGVFVWEYFNSDPVNWLETIKKVFCKEYMGLFCSIS